MAAAVAEIVNSKLRFCVVKDELIISQNWWIAEIKCPQLQGDNAVISPPSCAENPEVDLDETCTITCLKDYLFSDESPTKAFTCTMYTTWDPAPEQCKRMACPGLETRNAVMIPSDICENTTLVDLHENCTVKCPLGYQFADKNTSKSFTCTVKQTWDPLPPESLDCEEVSCGEVPVPDGVDVTTSNLLYEAIARLSCMPGFRHVGGGDQLVCAASGSWVGEMILCQKIFCGPVPVPKNAMVLATSLDYKSIAKLKCMSGHWHTGGAEHLVCDASGRWNGEAIQCETPPMEGSDDSAELRRGSTSDLPWRWECDYYWDSGCATFGPSVVTCIAMLIASVIMLIRSY